MSNFKEKDFKGKSIFRLAGGKQRHIARLLSEMPKKWTHYFEIFLGGASLFFAQNIQTNNRYYLNDKNMFLIQTYQWIKDDPEKLFQQLLLIADKHSEKNYLNTKNQFNNEKGNTVLKAAQFIYLNRSSFNGVFRLNKKGEYNVPSGKKKRILIPTLDNLINISERFSSAQLTSTDFKDIFLKAKSGDFVYLDPPYLPIDGSKHFGYYVHPRFTLADLISLSEHAEKMRQKGVNILISNHDLPKVRELFDTKYWNFVNFEIHRTGLGKPRTQNQNIVRSKTVKELLIKSY